MDKLQAINNFLKVAEFGSFAATAAHKGVDPSTISKSIHQLEAQLGCRLFIRTTRKLQLSTAGQQYRDHCALLMDNLSACEQTLAAGQHEAKGLLKINLPVAYGQLYILPLMGRFREKYPAIDLDISLADDYVDMVGHSIDVAIRSGKLQDSRLVAKKLSPMDFATAASPDFITKNPGLNEQPLEQLPWISYRFIHSGRTMPLFKLSGTDPCKQTEPIHPHVVCTTTDGLSMVRAAIAGIGLVQAPHFLLRDAVTQGELSLIQSYFRYEEFNVSAYYTTKNYLPLRVKVFLDFIADELAHMGEGLEDTFLSTR